MHRNTTEMKLGLIAGVALLALAGCDRAVPAAERSSAAPQPAAVAAAVPAADASAAAVPASAQAQAAVAASSTAPAEPAVSSMTLAKAPHKLGAPVDLRYQFDGDAVSGRSVTLHLAAVPRVAGGKLTMSIKKESGISTNASELTAQKVSASTAYRQDVLVTKLAGGPSELHVLVVMEVPEGSAHSWFNIPFAGAPAAAGKQQPIRLE